MRIHHATTTKATKLGFELSAVENKVTCRDPKSGLSITHGNPTQVVEDLKTLRMLRSNYPEFKVLMQPEPLMWTLKQGAKIAAQHTSLEEAFFLATENSKPKRQRKAKAAEVEETEDDEAEEGDDETDDETEETEEEEASEVVKAKYREKYKPHNDSCGDDIARKLTELVVEQQSVTVTNKKTGKSRTRSLPRVNIGVLKEFAETNGVWEAKYSDLNPGMQRMNVANRLRAKARRGEQIDWSV